MEKKGSFGVNFINQGEVTARSIEEVPQETIGMEELEAKKPLVYIQPYDEGKVNPVKRRQDEKFWRSGQPGAITANIFTKSKGAFSENENQTAVLSTEQLINKSQESSMLFNYNDDPSN